MTLTAAGCSWAAGQVLDSSGQAQAKAGPGSGGGVCLEVTAWVCSTQVQAEIKRKWRSWKVNRYFAVDFKHRHPSLASSGVNGGTQLSILSKSSSQLRMSGLPADNLAT